MFNSALLLLSPLVILQAAPAAQQPAAPVTLTVRLTEDRRQFRPGEIIPIALEFSSDTAKRFAVDGATYDRSGRLTLDEFVIDRIDDVSDPLLDYFGSIGGGVGGGIRGMGRLGEKPYTVRLELNEWFRFDKPGTYTLAVRSRRVTDESVTPHAIVPVESNTVSFEILPREAAWEASVLADARKLADASNAGREGCRMLRFLGTGAAVVEMVRRYGTGPNNGCDFDYMAGLFGAPNRDAVVRTMEDALRAADQPVTAGYLRTLSALAVYLRHPEMRPAQTPAAKGRLTYDGELRRRPDLIEAAMSAYREMVAAALPDKTGQARAITLVEMQALDQQRQPSERSTASRTLIAAGFLDLPADRQATILEHQWPTVAGPEILPALRRLVDSPESAPASIPDLALRRLAQLAPDEARPLILREIRNPRRGATLKTLGSLPDRELPDLDEVLAANFEASHSEINAALVNRYATRKVAPRILASAGELIGRLACAQQNAVLAYVLRADEATGATLLDRAMSSRVTGCWQILHEAPGLRITPALEARAIADLDNPDPEVVIAAIRMLGRHGSATALEPLRAAFHRWHAVWKDRAAELVYTPAVERPHARQAMVEDAFRQAIGTGHGWLMRANQLRDLQPLCVTDNCRTQVTQMIRDDDTKIMLWSLNEPDQSHIQLAHYTFQSLAALEEKLTRYPRGTTFTVQTTSNPPEEITAAIGRLAAFAASRGLTIKRAP